MEQPYLAACTIYRDAASYLGEWIEFHRLMGVERFFLYDNGSSDEHRDLLAPYSEDGVVVVHDWAMPFIGRRGRSRASIRAFDHCLRAHREDARWIAFLDVDEFLFSPTGTALPELLREYEDHSGVCVSRADFRSSGHRERPEGLLIENYTHRRPVRPDDHVPVKSIVDPRRTAAALGAHTFVYNEGGAVDELGRPVDQLDSRGLKPVSWSRFRINHYASRSQEETEAKQERWRTLGSSGRARGPAPPAGGELDETLVADAPAGREAIKRARTRARPRR
jgi:hypothetical protein